MPKGVPKDQSLKRLLVHRLKIVRGHLDSVIKMVEDDVYCINVLNQSLAVQKALKGIDNLILENHLKTCAADAIKKDKKEVLREIVNVFKKAGE